MQSFDFRLAYSLPRAEESSATTARASTGEALYELGLRNDDVLVSLNGKPLGTFDEAFEAFALHLNDTTFYTLIVTRSGNTTTLKYKIL